MQGIIVTNPYSYPTNSKKQAKRVKSEFDLLGVKVDIVDNGFLKVCLEKNTLSSTLKNIDFAVFLDKDKYLSNILTKLGIRLFNRHEAIRVCDDKGETCLALINSGVKMPKTMFAPLCYRENDSIGFDYANEIINNLSLPIIIKESFGSMGYGVHKADTKEEFIEIEKKLKLKPRIYQEYIGYKKGTDVRVIVIGDKVVASMQRENKDDFRSNIGHGGKGKKIDLPKSFENVALECAKVLGLDYCGVDLLYDKDDNPIVCEVNSNAFFEGIEEVTKINVGKKYAEYIIEQIKNR